MTHRKRNTCFQNARQCWRGVLTVSLLVVECAVAAPAYSIQEESSPPKSETVEAHVGKGYEAVKDERYHEAAKEFQAALALNPDLPRARYQLAVCYFALGKAPEARQEFERLEKETGSDPSVIYYLARLDLRARDTQAAIDKLSRLMKKPPFPDTAYFLGLAYLEKRELDQAEK